MTLGDHSALQLKKARPIFEGLNLQTVTGMPLSLLVFKFQGDWQMIGQTWEDEVIAARSSVEKAKARNRTGSIFYRWWASGPSGLSWVWYSGCHMWVENTPPSPFRPISAS